MKSKFFTENTTMKSLFEQIGDTYHDENGYLADIDKQAEDMFSGLVKHLRLTEARLQEDEPLSAAVLLVIFFIVRPTGYNMYFS